MNHRGGELTISDANLIQFFMKFLDILGSQKFGGEVSTAKINSNKHGVMPFFSGFVGTWKKPL